MKIIGGRSSNSKLYGVNIYGATSPGGGIWGSRKLRNMKCSGSDFRPIEGTLSNSKWYGVNIYGQRGVWGSSPRNFRNMKCSRSDSRPILGFGFVNGGFEVL